jgi:hypothetical protein
MYRDSLQCVDTFLIICIVFLSLFFFFYSAQDWTQGLTCLTSELQPQPTNISLWCLLWMNYYFFLETRSHYIVQAGLKLTILLPLPLKYWGYSHGPPCLVEVYFIVVKFIILLWLITFCASFFFHFWWHWGLNSGCSTPWANLPVPFFHLKTSFCTPKWKNTLQYSLPKVSWLKGSWFCKSLFGVDWSLYMGWGQIQFLFLFSYMTIQWDQLISWD